MKNIKLFSQQCATTIISLFVAILLFGCKEEVKIEPEIILSKDELVFETEGASLSLALKSNLNWNITSSESWCVVNPVSGEAGTKQVTVTVGYNTTGNAREALIQVKAGSLTKAVKVKQLSLTVMVDVDTVKLNHGGENFSIQVTATNTFSLVMPEWIVKSETPNTYFVSANRLIFAREGKMYFVSGNQKDSVVVVQQAAPRVISSDMTRVEKNAMQLAAMIKNGINIGNTLEAPKTETAWGNPVITQLLVDSIKRAGFNAVRLPCAWHSHLSDPAKNIIDSRWLARVKEVVDYCYKADLYVIVNIHWDEGWLENNPTYAKQESVVAKQKTLWEQIAVYFRDYDEHLLFAGTNEVHANYGAPSAENIEVQQAYLQAFVDAVRATGGKNHYRNLVVQSYNTNIDYAVQKLKISNDVVAGRIFVEVHYYDPWDFCGDASSDIYLWGKPFSGLGKISTYGQEDYADKQFLKMKTNFVDKGYPVIMGEYGVLSRTSLPAIVLNNYLDSKDYYYQYVVKQAVKNGMIPFLWETGEVINRSTGVLKDRRTINTIRKMTQETQYPY